MGDRVTKSVEPLAQKTHDWETLVAPLLKDQAIPTAEGVFEPYNPELVIPEAPARPRRAAGSWYAATLKKYIFQNRVAANNTYYNAYDWTAAISTSLQGRFPIGSLVRVIARSGAWADVLITDTKGNPGIDLTKPVARKLGVNSDPVTLLLLRPKACSPEEKIAARDALLRESGRKQSRLPMAACHPYEVTIEWGRHEDAVDVRRPLQSYASRKKCDRGKDPSCDPMRQPRTGPTWNFIADHWRLASALAAAGMHRGALARLRIEAQFLSGVGFLVRPTLVEGPFPSEEAARAHKEKFCASPAAQGPQIKRLCDQADVRVEHWRRSPSARRLAKAPRPEPARPREPAVASERTPAVRRRIASRNPKLLD
jgi:hypothetical protein